MHILLTNDDGIEAPGLKALYHQFAGNHQVTVVAPDREQSAVGHGITLHHPIRARQIAGDNGYAPRAKNVDDFKGYAISGTPADCVKLALLELLESPPEMVISGINPGANVGVNVNYSGTVAAAREAARYGIPALAVAVKGVPVVNYSDVAAYTERLTTWVTCHRLPFGTFLNVNFPNIPLAEMSGARICRQEIPLFHERFDKRFDPRNRAYYWQGCDVQAGFKQPDSDGKALDERCIAVTPIQCDATDYGTLRQLQTGSISGLPIPGNGTDGAG